MLSKQQEQTIKQLHHKKGREKHGLCLVEGEKGIAAAKDQLSYTFTPDDTQNFQELVTTETPQEIAGVAHIPAYEHGDVLSSQRIVLLDGVQDPGNIGSILRLCQGFDAALILVECTDVTNPKVIRSSAGAFFSVRWGKIGRDEVRGVVENMDKDILRLEKTESSQPYTKLDKREFLLIAGAEGQGIQMDVDAPSVFVPHAQELESLNVAQAVGIVLSHTYSG